MDDPPARRQSRVRIAIAAASGVAVLALTGLWTQRTQIARDYVDAELARRGVEGRYAITRFGFGGQRLERIRIGDPARPDLTADYADLRIALGVNGPYLASVSAGGVRLRGRLVNGTVTFGAVDRLLPAPSGAPFSLPDLVVTLRDAAVRLETPAGVIGVGLAGQGRLSDGFAGRMAAVAPRLALRGCAIRRARAVVNIAIAARRPALDGPVAADGVMCDGGIALVRPAATIDLALNAALDRWSGGAFLNVAQARAGANVLHAVTGRIGYHGTATGTGGTVTLAADRFATRGLTAGRSDFDGQYRIGPEVRVKGALTLADGAADAATTRAIVAAGRTGAGTPIAPVVQAIATATARAGGRFDARAHVDFGQANGAFKLRLAQVTAVSDSGARLAVTEGGGLGIDGPSGAMRIDGRVAVAGGGLPTIAATLAQPAADAPITGTVRMADYAADGALLRMAPVQFRTAPGATRFDTVLTMDGPVASGRVAGLRLPIRGRLGRGGSFAINAACVPMTFDRLTLSGLAVGATRVGLCPGGPALLARAAGGAVRGGARIAAPVLMGTLGGAPVRIASDSLAIDLNGADFVARRLAVRLGPEDGRSLLDIDRFAGRFGDGGVGGRFDGLSGRILAVPLAMTEGAGQWQLADGVLHVAGETLTVSDTDAVARFRPLVSKTIALTLRDNVIATHGRLQVPATGTAVTDVTIRHDLNIGAGTARLAVPGIRFGPDLQPEQLTRLTLGVVANVKGTVTGEGVIAWNRRGVTSGGTFATESIDLAAAFGPVSGLKTRVVFDDLLALRTRPGQVATVIEINPGIAVRDGMVRYQLLPDQRVAIEDGRWPFSGGALTLEPTLLDFGGTRDRRMTFRVVGMDAAQFVQQFEFKNIAVTGIFDGVMPMIFDDRGGRIAGGRVAVRPGGGTLAYVGEISNADLGRFGSLAFDALKRMRYRDLTILLDGALDGELVSKVVFDGTNQTPKEAIRRNGLLSAFSNLPFRFNIVITAPFRALLNSAQSLNDPRGLIRQAMPTAEPPLPGSAPIQAQESEPVR
ncbi:MAG TPA: YdbH domain-containing protein [Sphingomonas sp.]|jgi:hypothetical protein|uniref:YdbH domain-containing protein n=1 Tax=Sphingomonas sp. TaxID=28214 RepID=UPI002ED91DAC